MFCCSMPGSIGAGPPLSPPDEPGLSRFSLPQRGLRSSSSEIAVYPTAKASGIREQLREQQRLEQASPLRHGRQAAAAAAATARPLPRSEERLPLAWQPCL